jgi:molybdenum cofactor cytidylyltransferase
MPAKIHGLVLAAGLSRRMGTFKQLLPFGGRTVVESVVGAVQDGGVDALTVVLGHRADEVREVLAPLNVATVVNEAYREGMFTSVLCGLRQVASADAVLLALVDQPQISASIVKAVIDSFRGGKAGIVIPVFGGKRGHPIVLDLPRYRVEIEGLTGEEGLKPVVRGHIEDTLELLIEDERILRDLDTPEDYERELALLRNSDSKDAS